MAMKGSRVASARIASSAPVAPRTSEMPTTPLTASVRTPLAVKHAPASHAVPRRLVSWKAMMQTSAPFMPCSRTFTQ